MSNEIKAFVYDDQFPDCENIENLIPHVRMSQKTNMDIRANELKKYMISLVNQFSQYAHWMPEENLRLEQLESFRCVSENLKGGGFFLTKICVF